MDFKNTVLIMTSNIGSRFIMDVHNKEQREALVTEALRNHFRPEFLDRLSDSNIGGIVKIRLQRVIKPLEKQNIHRTLDEEALQYVADQG